MTQAVLRANPAIEWPPYGFNVRSASVSANNVVIQLPSESVKLREMVNILDTIENWPENWDTYGAKKPNKRAKKTAEKFAQQFYNFVQRHALEWVNPNISANSDGNIVFEWWNKNNKLAVYAQPDEIFYITASNPNIEEMRDVTLELNDSGFSTMWESLQ